MNAAEEPRIIGIQIAEGKGDPMQAIDSVTALEGVGLEGDRYATGKGAWSKVRTEVPRHISLIESEAIEAANVERSLTMTFADTRRNILTAGIRLNELVGKQFRIGDVLVEGVELCDPCGRPGILFGKADLKQNFESVMQQRGGLRVRILSTGVLNTGDGISVT